MSIIIGVRLLAVHINFVITWLFKIICIEHWESNLVLVCSFREICAASIIVATDGSYDTVNSRVVWGFVAPFARQAKRGLFEDILAIFELRDFKFDMNILCYKRNIFNISNTLKWPWMTLNDLQIISSLTWGQFKQR